MHKEIRSGQKPSLSGRLLLSLLMTGVINSLDEIEACSIQMTAGSSCTGSFNYLFQVLWSFSILNFSRDLKSYRLLSLELLRDSSIWYSIQLSGLFSTNPSVVQHVKDRFSNYGWHSLCVLCILVPLW